MNFFLSIHSPYIILIETHKITFSNTRYVCRSPPILFVYFEVITKLNIYFVKSKWVI